MLYRDDLARRLHNYDIPLRTCGFAEGAQLMRELYHIDPNKYRNDFARRLRAFNLMVLISSVVGCQDAHTMPTQRLRSSRENFIALTRIIIATISRHGCTDSLSAFVGCRETHAMRMQGRWSFIISIPTSVAMISQHGLTTMAHS